MDRLSLESGRRKRPRRWIARLGISIGALLAAGATGQAMEPGGARFGPVSLIPAAPPTPDRVKAARDEADRMTVEVSLDGKGPFPFVVDTGADHTVVSRELANRLKLEDGQPVLLHGTAGAELTPTARIDELSVGARRLYDVSAPMLGAQALGAQGLLGIDSLRDQRMVMDFRRGSMAVERSRHESYGLDVIVVKAKSRYGELVLVDASINGRPLAVIVDSGAQNTIGNLALERQVMGVRVGAPAPTGEVISVSGRSTPARFASLPRVQIGGVTMRNLPIAFADLHTFSEFDMNGAPAMLLGMDVLRHFDRVVVDFGRRQVSFEVPDAG